MVSKTIGLEVVLGQALAGVAGVSLAFIFGSLAASSEGPSSDIDLMVIGTPKARELHTALRPAEQRLRREVHYFVFGADEFAQRVLDHDGFIADVLLHARTWVLGDEARLQALLVDASASGAE